MILLAEICILGKYLYVSHILFILYLDGNHTLFAEKFYLIWKFSSGNTVIKLIPRLHAAKIIWIAIFIKVAIQIKGLHDTKYPNTGPYQCFSYKNKRARQLSKFEGTKCEGVLPLSQGRDRVGKWPPT